MKDSNTLQGIADVEHQVYISFLITAINNHCWKYLKYERFIATPETNIFFNGEFKLPDVLIWNLEKNESNKPRIAIEVCKTEMVLENLNKLNNLMFKFPSLIQCFVIDYEKDTCKMIKRKKDKKISVTNNSSYVEFIKFDLAKCF